jgi:hypothetical protein
MQGKINLILIGLSFYSRLILRRRDFVTSLHCCKYVAIYSVRLSGKES